MEPINQDIKQKIGCQQTPIFTVNKHPRRKLSKETDSPSKVEVFLYLILLLNSRTKYSSK